MPCARTRQRQASSRVCVVLLCVSFYVGCVCGQNSEALCVLLGSTGTPLQFSPPSRDFGHAQPQNFFDMNLRELTHVSTGLTPVAHSSYLTQGYVFSPNDASRDSRRRTSFHYVPNGQMSPQRSPYVHSLPAGGAFGSYGGLSTIESGGSSSGLPIAMLSAARPPSPRSTSCSQDT